MKILVLVKQVPGTSEVEVDPVSGVLKRDGVEAKMNPYDLFPLEFAIATKEAMGAEIHVMTMGPPPAQQVLEEAIWIGADFGYLISDRKFGGADVVATSYTLSQAIRKAEEQVGKFDLILCGKQTTDGDTAQVGPETAEFLELEHAANVSRVYEIAANKITLDVNMDTYIVKQRMELSCLLTIEKDFNTPRLPSYKRKKLGTEGKITTYSFDDMPDQDESKYGLKGSPTQVERIFPPDKNEEKEIFQGDTQTLVQKLYSVLETHKFV